MAVNNAPYPSFAKLYYHSEFAPHVMTIPTHTYAPAGNVMTPGLYTCWDTTTISGLTMLNGLVNLLAPMFNTDVTFDREEIWVKSSPTAIPELAYINPTAISGTSTLTGWNEAVQRTYFLRGTANSAFKLILLDSPTDNLFGKYYVLTSPENAIISELTATNRAYQARKGDRPSFFRSLTITLNERLRREYHLR